MKVPMKIMQTAEGDYRAWCPPLPGCQVRARSISEARERLMEAIQSYLASLDMPAPQVGLAPATSGLSSPHSA